VHSVALLDLFDTLAYCDWAVLNQGAAQLLEVTPQEVRRARGATRHRRATGAYATVRESMVDIITSCGRSPDARLVESLTEFETEFFAREVHLYSDVLETLHGLRDARVRTALVSNCGLPVRDVVDRFRLHEVMDAVVLSCDVGATKPSGAIYTHALNVLGAAPADAVFVDDQASYCLAAAALGLRSVQIKRSVAFGPLTTDGGLQVIATLPEVAQLLLG
jgi:HAD superfamily hydrolase (TIGR01509 family)